MFNKYAVNQKLTNKMDELEFDSEIVDEDEGFEGEEYEGETQVSLSPSSTMDFR